jgi:hypothetical protein
MSDEIPVFEPEKVSSLFDRPVGARKPRADTTPNQGVPKAKGRPTKHNQRHEKLLSLLSTVGAGVAFFEQIDGQIILANAEAVAEATATLADENAQVAKAIDGLSTGGAWGAFIIALCGMIIPMLVHHNLVPAFLGTMFVPPDVVDRQQNAS